MNNHKSIDEIVSNAEVRGGGTPPSVPICSPQKTSLYELTIQKINDLVRHHKQVAEAYEDMKDSIPKDQSGQYYANMMKIIPFPNK